MTRWPSFSGTQEVGKFEKDELLSIATEALAKSKPSEKWARGAIRGALFDFVRTRDKLVTRWMDEDEYRAKAAELDDILPTARTARPKPCTIPSDNPLVEGWRKRHHVTVGPPPRRVRRRVRHPITGEMHELPSRIAASTGYKVNSKYNKVEVAPRRSSHQDGRDQNESGCSWKRRQDRGHREFRSYRSAQRHPLDRRPGRGSARTGREVVEGCQPAHAAHG